MALRFSWEDLAEQAATGSINWALNRTGLTLDQGCAIWRVSPGRFVTNFVNTPITSALRGAWDTLCQPRGALPPAPTPAFPGGQCPVSYRFIAQGRFRRESDGQIFVIDENVILTGPLGGIQSRNINSTQSEFFMTTGSGEHVLLTGFNFVTNEWLGWTVISVTRLDGQPDVCGDPPPQYPALPATPISFDIDQEYNDGGVELNIPVVYVPVDVTVAPIFRFNVGGIDFDFDVGGVTINLPGTGGSEGEFTSADRTTINNTLNAVLSIESGETQVNCDDSAVLAAIAALSTDVLGRFDSLDSALECIEARVRRAQPFELSLEEEQSLLLQGDTVAGELTTYVDTDVPGIAFVVLELEILPGFRDRIFAFRNDPQETEAAYGHVELCGEFDSPRLSVERGLGILSSKYVVIEIPPASPVKFVRFSLKRFLSYAVFDSGYRWVKFMPEECEEPAHP